MLHTVPAVSSPVNTVLGRARRVLASALRVSRYSDDCDLHAQAAYLECLIQGAEDALRLCLTVHPASVRRLASQTNSLIRIIDRVA